MFKALTTFTDLQDNNYKYQAGDIFPREGLEVSDERLTELLSDKNRRHKPVIEEIVEEQTVTEEPIVEEVEEDAVIEEQHEDDPAPKRRGRKKADAE
jgi:hypothetical protein